MKAVIGNAPSDARKMNADDLRSSLTAFSNKYDGVWEASDGTLAIVDQKDMIVFNHGHFYCHTNRNSAGGLWGNPEMTFRGTVEFVQLQLHRTPA